MLCLHLLQKWFGYSGPAMEKALCETTILHRFAGLRLGEPCKSLCFAKSPPSDDHGHWAGFFEEGLFQTFPEGSQNNRMTLAKPSLQAAPEWPGAGLKAARHLPRSASRNMKDY